MDRVAYKPLGTLADEELEDSEEYRLERPFSPRSSHNGQRQLISLRQLRLLLYLVAILLFLVFIAQLSGTNSKLPKSNLTIKGKHQLATSNQKLTDEKPQYDSYSKSLAPTNRDDKEQLDEQQSETQIHDDLLYPPLNLTYDRSPKESQLAPPSSQIWWKLDTRDSGKYVTISNYIRAMKSFNYNASLTLTTQATSEFMYHILELCERWDGPISVAVFSPGPEILVTNTLIKFMRQCLPGPLCECIKDKVTWHLVYNTKLNGHSPSGVNYPKLNLDSKNFPLFVNQNQCPKLPGPEPGDLIRQFEIEIRKKNGLYPRNYRQQLKLTYPINVLRNTARLAAKTKYILASDIELYPSINLVPAITNYLKRHDVIKEYRYEYKLDKFVFTLPIFEVKSNISSVPKTKQELIKLIKRGDAIFFHKWVCDACQNFPHRMDWLQTDKFGLDDYHSNIQDDKEIVVFEVTQRDKTRDSWEPIFIGTNEDPLYDDRLTWDGRRDKMAQMYEMCLQNYHLLVLGNAFLVHAPGIKHIDNKDTIKRLDYIRANNAIYDETMAKLRQRYSTSPNINIC